MPEAHLAVARLEGTLLLAAIRSDHRLDEEEAQVGRLRHLLSQRAKEGLVAHPEDWPRLNTASQLVRGYTEVNGGIWHDRTAEYHGRNRSKKPQAVRSSDFVEWHLCFRLSPLPCWSHLQKMQVAEAVKLVVRDIVETAALERGEAPVLGAKAVVRQDPWHRPDDGKRSYAPPCDAATRKARRDFLSEMREFADAFLEAAADLRDGKEAHFRAGAFRLAFRMSRRFLFLTDRAA